MKHIKFDREHIKGFYSILVFCCLISLGTLVISYSPILSLGIISLSVLLPFAVLDWFNEPTKAQKEQQERIDRLYEKMLEVNKHLDSLLKD